MIAGHEPITREMFIMTEPDRALPPIYHMVSFFLRSEYFIA